jgi:hypothetical protein
VFSLTGCFQVETLIRVKPDGSGTIEETFMMNKAIMQMMGGMLTQMGEGAGAQQPEQQILKEAFSLFDDAKLKQEAGDKGEGVTYVSGRRLSTETFEGYQATYAFTDINDEADVLRHENRHGNRC